MSSQKERVAVIGPFPALKGGISQHTAKLAEACEMAGMVVDRYSWSSQYPKRLYKREQVDDSAAETAGVRWWLQWWNPLSWVRVGRSVRHHDVVVLPWVSPVHAIAQIVLLVMARRTMSVFHVHNVLPHEPMPMASFFARRVLTRADLLVCHAESIADDIRELGIQTSVVVTPLPPLISLEPSPLPDRPPTRLLFVGTIREYKGLDIAIDAAEEVAERGYSLELTIAGEVWDEACAPLAEELSQRSIPIEARYRYVTDEELAQLLESHHLVVAPYRAATQSGVVPLAFAAGRPVVVTTVGGLTELVHEGFNGSLAVPDDPNDFGAAIERALDSLETLAVGAAESRVLWSGYAELLLERIRVRSRAGRATKEPGPQGGPEIQRPISARDESK